ncbi:MAG: ABC transporter ATP-binding protein [bacterium]|nr:ABC transporter ATP-binding protein [bacterium]
MTQEHEPLVVVRDLHKTYKVFARPLDRLIEALTRRPRHRPFHALQSVTFDVAPGEGIGIIGENGAGKSTLLKILSGVTAPSSGSTVVTGRTASILELGSAFHPEMTGRQNISLNAAMLGLSQSQIIEKTPEILEFSELGEFIDQPVKVYSTGMLMRLGFSIATQVEPDLLIVDEALSVGDGYFQKKCMDRLQQYVKSGGTILFCSHALYYISAFCKRALWLKDGKIEKLGPVQEVIHSYEKFLMAKSEGPKDADRGDVLKEKPKPARITDVRLLPEGKTRFRKGEAWELEISWESLDEDMEFHLGVGIDRIDGVQTCSFGSHRSGIDSWSGRRNYQAHIRVDELPLVKGDFTLYVFLLAEDDLHVHDTKIIEEAFSIESDEFVIGLVDVPHEWHSD